MWKSKSGEGGSATVELALTVPLLLLLLIGSAELGRIAYASIEVADAARAATAYAAQDPFDAGQTTLIEDAAQNEAYDLTLTWPSGSVATYCVCQTTNSSTGQATTTSQISCASSTAQSSTYCETSTTNDVTNTVVQYVVAEPQATVATMFRYPGIPSSFTLNGFSEMRVLGY